MSCWIKVADLLGIVTFIYSRTAAAGGLIDSAYSASNLVSRACTYLASKLCDACIHAFIYLSKVCVIGAFDHYRPPCHLKVPLGIESARATQVAGVDLTKAYSQFTTDASCLIDKDDTSAIDTDVGNMWCVASHFVLLCPVPIVGPFVQDTSSHTRAHHDRVTGTWASS